MNIINYNILNKMQPVVIDRTDKPCLKYSSNICDLSAVCCAVPFMACGPCAYMCQGPYSFMDFKPPPKQPKTLFDNWYRASIFSLHGGSLLQLLATQSVFWSFPRVEQKEGYNIHNIEVYPSNSCGKCCFSPLVTSMKPQFRIKKIDNVYSVRLTTNMCCCGIKKCTSTELNDVWSVSANGKIITSVKTRGHVPCGSDFCVSMSATGPAMFVAVDYSGPSLADVNKALLSDH